MLPLRRRRANGFGLPSTRFKPVPIITACITAIRHVDENGWDDYTARIGESDGTAAPRLADTRPRDGELAGLWDQLVQALVTLAGHGLAHGDMSAYNLLVHHGRLIMIDLPQVVDVIANPRGAELLDRDATNVARWFSAHGLDGTAPGLQHLPALLRNEAGIR